MAITTGGLTATMQTFYSKVFLERAKLLLKHDTFAQKRGIPANGGKTVSFTRHVIPAVATTGLTEALNPAGVDATGTAVTATLVDYGAYTQISSLYDRASIDAGLEEQISVFGQHSGESIDTIIRNALTLAGAVTGYFVSGNATTTSSSNLVATDVVNSYLVRRVVRSLKKNKALPVIGSQGNPVFGGLIGPEAAYDMFGDSTWQAMQQYVNADPMKRGILGTQFGVEWVESNNLYITVPTSAAIYTTWIMGDQSLGVVTIDSEDVAGATNTQLIVKESGPNDTGNPLNMFSTIGWHAVLAPKVLNCDWIVEVYSGATA